MTPSRPIGTRFSEFFGKYGVDLLLSFIPCVVLFLNPSALHYEDWENWVWVGAFQADAVWLNGVFASAIHSQEFVGYTGPIFYGTLFFRILGLLAIPLGAAIAVRLLAWFIFFAQIRGARVLFEKIGLPPNQAALLGAIQGWSAYQMTNLYNRSALPEFFAFQALGAGFLLILSGLLEPEDPHAQKRELGFGLAALVVAAGSHPITALLGGLFGILMVPLVVLGFPRFRIHRSTWPWLLGFVVLGIGISSPWLYAVAPYRSDFRISGTYGRMIRFDFDTFGNRLLPFPYDPRTWTAAARSLPTPWLDAQINVPLLVIFIALLILGGISAGHLHRRIKLTFWTIGLICAALTASLLFISVEGSEIESVAVLFRIVQFEYRLINYVNLSLMFGVVLLMQLAWKAMESHRRVLVCFQQIVLIVFGASLLLTVEKSYHGYLGVVGRSDLYTGPSMLHASAHRISPASFINYTDYTTPGLLRDVPPGNAPSRGVALPLGPGFNQVGTAAVVLSQTTRLETNVLTFPWNHLTLDGRDLGFAELVPGADKYHLGLVVPPGAHEIGYRFEMPVFYRLLDGIRWICGIAWIGAVGYLLGRRVDRAH